MTNDAPNATTLSDPEDRSVQEAIAVLDRLVQTPRPSDPEFGSPAQRRPGDGRADPVGQRRLTAEAKYQALVEQIPAVTFMAPLDGSTSELYVSPQIRELLGFSPREWLEDPVLWYRQLHPDDKERWQEQFASTVNSGVPFRADYRFIARDGRVVWVHGEAKLVTDEGGRPLCLQGVAFDITEIKQAENEFRQFHLLVSSVQDYAIYSIDPAGCVLTWNQGAERIKGYRSDEAVGRHISMFLLPEDIERGELAHAMRQAAATGRYESEGWRVRKDGARIWANVVMTALRDASGTLHGFSNITRDLTERRQIEDRLQRAHDEMEHRVQERTAQMHFLADASLELASIVDYESTMRRIARLAVPFLADGCIVDMVDAKGNIQRVAYAHANPHKEPIVKELVTSYPLDWDNNSLSVKVLRSGKAELLAELPAAYFDRIARDQRHRELLAELNLCSALSAPIVIRDSAVGTLNFIISESQRQFSSADVNLASELANRSAVAIENAGLYRDLKEAQRQKDDFLAMLAHELRNPISAIQYANELSRMVPPEEYRASDVIGRQVANLVHLINDLLDVSRITRDKIQLNCERIDGAVVLQRAAVTTETLIKSRRHTLHVELPREPLPLCVDPTRAEQIFVNLLTNAAKYTPERGRITVRAFAADGSAVFQVSDNGLGIPEGMLQRVFDLFTQVNPTLDRSQGGLGIGLTLVRKLTELHGGSVTATSEGPGRGSQFTVRLPLAVVANQTERASTEVGVSSGGKPLRKILVVDDNLDTARSAALLLEMSGHKVEMAHDGFAALKAAKSFQPEVIVLDLGLPGLDGYQVAEALRANSDFVRTRLVALSGYGQPQDLIRSKEAGFDLHLVKPVDFETLANAVEGN